MSLITWDDTVVEESVPEICGNLVYSITEQGGVTLDSIFTFDAASDSLGVYTAV